MLHISPFSIEKWVFQDTRTRWYSDKSGKLYDRDAEDEDDEEGEEVGQLLPDF
jgi:hypothetical protein